LAKSIIPDFPGEKLMNDQTYRLEGDESDVRPAEVARRAVLRHGAKLAYVVPAIIMAAWAPPAWAASHHDHDKDHDH
jgi:hypothetical protein